MQGALKDKDVAAAGLKGDVARLQSELSETRALLEAGNLKRKQLRIELNDRLQAMQGDLDAVCTMLLRCLRSSVPESQLVAQACPHSHV